MNETVKIEGWDFVDEYSYEELPSDKRPTLEVAAGENRLLAIVKKRVETDVEIRALWKCSNVVAMARLGYSDHGQRHVEIVANHALKALRLLEAAGVSPTIVRDYGLTYEDAEVVVFLGACLHDIGHSIHRDNHTQYSVYLAAPILHKLLADLYPPQTIPVVASEVLHCIAVHHKDSKPLTIEAGVVRVCDALDMAHGRTRLWDPSQYSCNIHAVSAKAIESVEISAGTKKPVLIKITMSGSAGVFQVDELLKPKLLDSGLRDYVQIESKVTCESGIVSDFTLE